jgi:hypothetical protein
VPPGIRGHPKWPLGVIPIDGDTGDRGRYRQQPASWPNISCQRGDSRFDRALMIGAGSSTAVLAGAQHIVLIGPLRRTDDDDLTYRGEARSGEPPSPFHTAVST